MRNLPAIKSEYRQIGRAYTDPHIVIQIKSFKSKGEMLQGFDQTADVYKWNNRLYNMAGNKTEAIKLPHINMHSFNNWKSVCASLILVLRLSYWHSCLC